MEVWCWGWVFSNWGGAEGLILFWTIGLVFSRLSFLHSKIIIKIVS